MVDIRTVCPACQTKVGLEPSKIMLLREHPDWADEDRAGSYVYVCSACSEVVAQWATTAAVRVLVLAGATVWTDAIDTCEQARPEHPESPPAGRSIAADDLLDFHLLLETDGWFQQLLASEREGSQAHTGER